MPHKNYRLSLPGDSIVTAKAPLRFPMWFAFGTEDGHIYIGECQEQMLHNGRLSLYHWYINRLTWYLTLSFNIFVLCYMKDHQIACVIFRVTSVSQVIMTVPN